MIAFNPEDLMRDLVLRGKAPSPRPIPNLPAGGNPFAHIENLAQRNIGPQDRSGARKGQFLVKQQIIDNYAPDFKVNTDPLDRAEEMMFRANQLNQQAQIMRATRPVDFLGGPQAIDLSRFKVGKSAKQPVAKRAKTSGRFGRFVKAISGKESGGSYKAVNPDSGAMGRYQIMPGNIAGPGGWDKEILGRNITTQQFMNSPKLQDKIARGKLRQYYNKYGVRGAASAWYSGDPNKWRNTSPQGGYPSIHAYVMDILRRMK